MFDSRNGASGTEVGRRSALRTGRQVEDAQATSDADQAASVADQAASDVDQASSAAELVASQAAQHRSNLDQQASDAEQVAADIESASGPPNSAAEDAAYAAGRAHRDRASEARSVADSSRHEADAIRAGQDASRADASQRRDAAGAARDRSSELRDLRAAAIERAAPGVEDRVLGTQPVGAHPSAAAARGAAAAARVLAADGRREAAVARAQRLIEAAMVAVEQAHLADGNDDPLPQSGQRADHIRELLPGALARNELSLVFQPIFDLRGAGAVVGLEALLRWDSPQLGPVRPDEFIPEAERTGLIAPIGEWVLDDAVRTVAAWRAVPGCHDLTVAVNAAPEQLTPPFVDVVRGSLAAAALPAGALTIEVTERTLVTDHDSMQAVSEELRSLGVCVAVDDFGTGFSSLGRLAHLGLDELKIDRIFVDGIETDRRQRALVAGIVAMSVALGLRVVAEGIETEEQRTILVELGCQFGQGFWLARPQSPAEINAWLSSSA